MCKSTRAKKVHQSEDSIHTANGSVNVTQQLGPTKEFHKTYKVDDSTGSLKVTYLSPSQLFIIITVKHYCLQQSSLSIAAQLFC